MVKERHAALGLDQQLRINFLKNIDARREINNSDPIDFVRGMGLHILQYCFPNPLLDTIQKRK